MILFTNDLGSVVRFRRVHVFFDYTLFYINRDEILLNVTLNSHTYNSSAQIGYHDNIIYKYNKKQGQSLSI